MLGESYAHLDIDARFREWVTSEKPLEPSSIVIAWLGENPFAHNDPRYAPGFRYKFSPLNDWANRVVAEPPP